MGRLYSLVASAGDIGIMVGSSEYNAHSATVMLVTSDIIKKIPKFSIIVIYLPLLFWTPSHFPWILEASCVRQKWSWARATISFWEDSWHLSQILDIVYRNFYGVDATIRHNLQETALHCQVLCRVPSCTGGCFVWLRQINNILLRIMNLFQEIFQNFISRDISSSSSFSAKQTHLSKCSQFFLDK